MIISMIDIMYCLKSQGQFRNPYRCHQLGVVCFLSILGLLAFMGLFTIQEPRRNAYLHRIIRSGSHRMDTVWPQQSNRTLLLSPLI